MARPNSLADPEFAKLVAEVYVSGCSREEAARKLDCGKDTMRVWVKDPRVRAHIRRMAQERVDRISRRIDGEIEARLAHVSDWELDELLKVRKEYLDRPLKLAQDGGANEAGATNEIAEAMDQDPELATELLALLDQRSGKDRPKPTR